jgi:contactin associated protein-like 2
MLTFGRWCNCDADLETWQIDGGEITEMEHLPVKQLRFGDTGNPLDEKEGRYSLGPLVCEGDSKCQLQIATVQQWFRQF